MARSKISRRLRDNLRTLHRLAVPEGCSILFTGEQETRIWKVSMEKHYNCYFNTLSITCVGRILEVRWQWKVFWGSTATVYVPLPWLDLVWPWPYYERTLASNNNYKIKRVLHLSKSATVAEELKIPLHKMVPALADAASKGVSANEDFISIYGMTGWRGWRRPGRTRFFEAKTQERQPL